MALPSDISGLYAWYKADSFSLNDGDTCGNWTDSSGNGRTLTVSNTPVYKANQIAGYPAVRFVGSDADSFYHLTFNWLTSLANHTIFAVFMPSNGSYTGGVFGSAGGSGSECIRWDGTNVAGRSDSGSISGGTLDVNNWCYGYKSQTNNSTIGCSLNGGTEATTSDGSGRPGTETCYVGQDGGTYFSGDLAEAFVYSSNLSSSDKSLMNDYLNGKYFNVTPTQNDRVRDVLSRRLWLLRRPNGVYEVTVPLWAFNASILDRVALESRTGPDPSGEGWKSKKWQRRAFSVQRVDFDPGSMSVKLQLLDRRPLDILLWDTGRSNVSGIASLDAGRENGIARLTPGSTRTYARASKAWVVNPADETSCVEVSTGRPAVDYVGELFEEERTNHVLRSSFVSGTTGLTLSGTGTNGSAIAADTTDSFFNVETGADSLKFTAGNPHTADLRATFPATASIAANTKVVVSIDHKTDNGGALSWRLQRGVDSWYYNASTPGWQSGAVDNALTAHSDRDPDDRAVVAPFSVGASNTTLTLSVVLPSGGTASRVSHLYHVQIESGTFPTSRIMTDAATVTRLEPSLTYEATTGAKCYNPTLGTFHCEFIPHWNSADLGSTEDMTIFRMSTNGGGDYDRLYYDASAGAWKFEREVGSTTYTASLTASVTRGTTYKLAARWTGADGELDLSNYTISVFVDGVKGTDATSAAPTFTSPETLRIGSDTASTLHANGAVRDRRIYPYALTDDEISDMEAAG